MRQLLGSFAEHRCYAFDAVRNQSYRNAIARVLNPGDVVLDLGSGTGLLGLMALQHGAARVYSVDSSPMLGIARENYRRNGFADRAVCLREHSSAVCLPEQVDVVIADQASAFGYNAGLLQSFHDARQRLLKPTGRLIPQRLRLFLAAVDDPAAWKESTFWSTLHEGLDLGAMDSKARHLPVYCSGNDTPVTWLSRPGTIADLPLGQHDGKSVRGAISLAIETPGTIHGLAGWFEIELAPEVFITNSPLAAERIDREYLFFPLESAVAVAPGDRVDAELVASPVDSMTSWKVSVIRGTSPDSPVSTKKSTFFGSLTTAEELRRKRPDFAPQLTPRAAARLTALQLFNGQRTIREIEDEVFRRHSAILSTREAAASLVASVVESHSR